MSVDEQKKIFETWLRQYKGLIFKIVRAYAPAGSREDLFQDIAIQVWHSVSAFREESSVTTWIYRVSLNTAIKWKRNERKHQQADPLDHVQYILQENKVHTDDRLEWLYEEIHKLDEVDRSIALLVLDDFSYKEMAAILGITESNVGVKINRIKRELILKSKKYDHHGI